MEDQLVTFILGLLNRDTAGGGLLYVLVSGVLIFVIRMYLKKNNESHEAHRAAIRQVDTKVDKVSAEVHEIKETVSNIKGRMNL